MHLGAALSEATPEENLLGDQTQETGSVVSVQFPQFYNHSLLHPLDPENTAGIGSMSHWNPVSADTCAVAPCSVAGGSLHDSTGAASSISFTFSNWTREDNPANEFAAPVTPGSADFYLMTGANFTQNSASPSMNLTVSGLDATHTYSLLAYVTVPNWASGSSGYTTLNGLSYYIQGNNSFSSYVQATSQTTGVYSPANYVLYSGLTGSVSQTMTLTGTTIGLSGFQVIDTTSGAGTVPIIPSTPSPSTSGIVNSPTVPPGYTLSFDDEFTSLSTIANTSAATEPGAKWFTHTVQCCLMPSDGAPTSMDGTDDGLSTYTMTPDGLDIRLQKTANGWSSGVLATVDSSSAGFSSTYGYYEMKAKLPAGSAVWPSLWMLNVPNNTGQDPDEVDIMEGIMQFPNVYNTVLHDWNQNFVNNNNGNSTEAIAQFIGTTDLSKDFHVYGMLWTPQTMTFYTDGVQYFQTPTPKNLNQPNYLILDLGLGGGWPTAQTPSQNDMIVRYMRVYASN